MDSIVTVSALGADVPDAALCIVHPPGDRFAAIEDAAAVTGLPIVRIAREIDPAVRRSSELGFLNGHVPVTAVITAAALVAAVLDRRDAVVLSNEWSASVPTLVRDGHPVNHQWSKGAEFEAGLRGLVAIDPRNAAIGLLLPALSERAVGRSRVRLPRRVPRGVPQLQSIVPPRPGQAARPVVRHVRQVLLHRSHPLAVHEGRRARRRLRRSRAPGRTPHLEARFSTMLGLAPRPSPSSASVT